MYAIPGLLGLIVFTYIRPQEFVPQIAGIPWINMWLLMIIGGFAMDIGTGKIRKEKTPTLFWSVAFYGWCIFTLAIRSPGEISKTITLLTTGIGLSLVIQHDVQDMKAFKRICATVFVTAMFCVTVAFHQGFQDFQCVAQVPSEDPNDPPISVPDGRPCARPDSCNEEAGAKEGIEYLCEHVGLFGTHSISTGRVRWRGVLMDPNETTLAAGTSIPFALAFFEIRRTLLRLLLVLLTVVIVVVTDVFSQSRGAILIFLTVLGVYFVRKYGIRGLMIGGAMGAPLMMLGGRSGEEAAQSAQERMEVMTEGLQMFLGSPIFGVGWTQFTKYSFLTAHNAYILAGAELGLPGFWMWTCIVYINMKNLIFAFKRYANVPGADEIRAFGLALFASFCGTLVGIFFLSWTYHYVLWIFFGLGGAFYTTLRSTDPYFDVTPSKKEYGALLVACLAFMIGMRFYMKLKGH
jgi:hypothetical protein